MFSYTDQDTLRLYYQKKGIDKSMEIETLNRSKSVEHQLLMVRVNLLITIFILHSDYDECNCCVLAYIYMSAIPHLKSENLLRPTQTFNHNSDQHIN